MHYMNNFKLENDTNFIVEYQLVLGDEVINSIILPKKKKDHYFRELGPVNINIEKVYSTKGREFDFENLSGYIPRTKSKQLYPYRLISEIIRIGDEKVYRFMEVPLDSDGEEFTLIY